MITQIAGRALRASSSGSLRSSSSKIIRLGTEVLPTMSQAVVHGNTVYTSGMVDRSADDLEGQMQNVLAKIDAYLEEAGTDKSKLLTGTVWLKNIERDFAAMNEVWNEWIDPDNKPVRATTQAALASPNLLIEIQVTAAKE